MTTAGGEPESATPGASRIDGTLPSGLTEPPLVAPLPPLPPLPEFPPPVPPAPAEPPAPPAPDMPPAPDDPGRCRRGSVARVRTVGLPLPVSGWSHTGGRREAPEASAERDGQEQTKNKTALHGASCFLCGWATTPPRSVGSTLAREPTKDQASNSVKIGLDRSAPITVPFPPVTADRYSGSPWLESGVVLLHNGEDLRSLEAFWRSGGLDELTRCRPASMVFLVCACARWLRR